MGEFVAFVIGWNLTLEHVIGTASLARGYSGYLGTLFNLPKANHTDAGDWVPEFMTGYVTQFDGLAFFLTTLVTGLLLLGVQVSSRFQITFATLNLSVACFIFICGLFKADFHNWNLSKAEIPERAGEGGFLPFGLTGVIQGAGTCFFAFVGFDGIAATAEEVKNPRKAIPNSILWTSAIIFVTYCCMATIQTLIWPYWDQKQAAPLPYIFEQLNMPIAKWTVLVGVLAGLSTSFVGGFLPLPRILYAMARDGVIYRVLSKISKRFRVPIVATIVGGILIACLASMLEIDQLADMLSIGTLAAYSLVSISVLLLRYEHTKPSNCSNPLPITYQDHVSSLADGAKVLATDESLANANGNGGHPNGTSQQDGRDESQQALKENKNAGTQTPEGKNSARRKLGKATSEGCKAIDNGKSDPQESGIDVGVKHSTTGDTSRSISLSYSSVSGSSSSSGVDTSLSLNCSTSTSRSLLDLFVEGTRGPNDQIRRPDAQTTHISRVIILLLVIVTTLLDFCLVIWGPTLYLFEPSAIIAIGLTFALTILLTFMLNRLPVCEPSASSFEVPLVPLIPLFSVIINTYLMLNLSVMTWIRFAVWMFLGFFIYFTYGIFNSTGYKDSRCD